MKKKIDVEEYIENLPKRITTWLNKKPMYIRIPLYVLYIPMALIFGAIIYGLTITFCTTMMFIIYPCLIGPIMYILGDKDAI